MPEIKREALVHKLREKARTTSGGNEVVCLLMEAAVTIETMEKEFSMAILMNDMANYIDNQDRKTGSR